MMEFVMFRFHVEIDVINAEMRLVHAWNLSVTHAITAMKNSFFFKYWSKYKLSDVTYLEIIFECR